jgi:hypothetical protein
MGPVTRFNVPGDPSGIMGDLADLASGADPKAAEIETLFAEVPLSLRGLA